MDRRCRVAGWPASWLRDGSHRQQRTVPEIKPTHPLARTLRDLELQRLAHWHATFSKLIAEGCRVFAEVIFSDEHKLAFQRELLKFLWERRDGKINLNIWLREAYEGLLSELMDGSRTLDDEHATLTAFTGRTGKDGDAEAMTLGQFAGDGQGNDRITLSTLHSAKGREFRIVLLFAMDDGRIPRAGATPAEQREARRLFYVGFTRPKEELHVLYTAARPSPFVLEVQERVERDELG